MSSARNEIRAEPPHARAACAVSWLKSLTTASKTPGIQYASGCADIRRKGAVDAATMMAYSMSKTITAAAVLQLVEHASGASFCSFVAERILQPLTIEPRRLAFYVTTRDLA